MTDLAKKLEALMAFDSDEAHAAYLKNEAIVRRYGTHEEFYIFGSSYQHARDLEVLRKMAQALVVADNALLNWVLYEKTCIAKDGPYVSLAIPQMIECAEQARAEIARLVSE